MHTQLADHVQGRCSAGSAAAGPGLQALVLYHCCLPEPAPGCGHAVEGVRLLAVGCGCSQRCSERLDRLQAWQRFVAVLLLVAPARQNNNVHLVCMCEQQTADVSSIYKGTMLCLGHYQSSCNSGQLRIVAGVTVIPSFNAVCWMMQMAVSDLWGCPRLEGGRSIS